MSDVSVAVQSLMGIRTLVDVSLSVFLCGLRICDLQYVVAYS